MPADVYNDLEVPPMLFDAATSKQIEAKSEQLAQLRSEIVALKKSGSALPVQDYELTAPDGGKVKLSEAFGPHSQLVLIHNMGFACPYCTMWADGFNGLWRYVARRAGFVLVSNDEPEKQQRGREKRGWTFPMLSARGTELFADLGFKGDDGGWWPGVSTLKKNADGSLARIGSDFFGPGDMYNGAWHLFDLLEDKNEGIEPTAGISDQKV